MKALLFSATLALLAIPSAAHAQEEGEVQTRFYDFGDMLIDGTIITGTGALIGGLASDIPYPESGRKMHFHFEEAAGATLFYDGSANHLNATCGSASSPTGS